jgi:hypothetical protein
MADPVYLGVNELGIQVWRTKEGEMRPNLDERGNNLCPHCDHYHPNPHRFVLSMDTAEGREWVVVACDNCKRVSYIMEVVLCRFHVADVPKLTTFHPDPHHEVEVSDG